VLNRCALTSSLINSAFGFATRTNRSVDQHPDFHPCSAEAVPATDRIRVSSSSMALRRHGDIEERCEPCRAQVDVDLDRAHLDPFRSRQ